MSCIYKYKGKDYTKDEFYSLVRTTMVQPRTVQKYTKILFPTGDTASRIEGHATLEEFKKQKEERLKELNDDISYLQDIENGKKTIQEIRDDYRGLVNTRSEINGLDIPMLLIQKQAKNNIINKQREADQLKSELQRIETEGFGALKPIYNFYENQVKNILNKVYGKENVKVITDEYGNTWNEVQLTSKMLNTILLQQKPINKEKPIKELNEQLIQLLNKLGVSTTSLKEYKEWYKNKYGEDLDVNPVAIADLTNKLIAIDEDKESSNTLPEEVSHFIMAVIKQNNPEFYSKLEDLVTEDPRYADIFKQYINTYKGDIAKVKFEALGKLLSTSLINEFKAQEGQSSKLIQGLKRLFEKFMNLFKKDKKLTEEIDDLAKQILGKEIKLGEFELKGSYYELDVEKYKTSEQLSNFKDKLESLIKKRYQRLKIYENKALKDYSALERSRVEKLLNLYKQDQVTLGIIEFINSTAHDAELSRKRLVAELKAEKNPREIAKILREIKDYTLPFKNTLSELKTELKLEDNPEFKEIISELTDVLSNLEDIENLYKEVSTDVLAKALYEFKGNNTDIKSPADLAHLLRESKDISITSRFLDSLAESNDDILGLLDRITKERKETARINAFYKIRELLALDKKLKDNGIKDTTFAYEEANGKRTGNIISEYNQGLFEQNRDKFSEELIKKIKEDYKIELSSDPDERDIQLSKNKAADKFYRLSWKNWFKANTQVNPNAQSIIEAKKSYFKDYYGDEKFGKDKLRWELAFEDWFNSNSIVKSYRGVDTLFYTNELTLPSEKYLNDKYKSLKPLEREYINKIWEIKEEEDKFLPTSKKYLAPQIRKDEFERLKTKGIKATAKEAVEDLKIRESDTDFGVKLLTDIDNKPVSFIPTYFTSKVPIEDLSTDLTSTMSSYIAMSENYKEMQKILPILEMGEDVLSERKIIVGESALNKAFEKFNLSSSKAYDRQKGGNSYERYKDWMQMVVYGKMKEEEEWFNLFGLNTVKVIDAFNKYTSISGLAFNVYSGINNIVLGNALARQEAFAREFIGKGGLTFADKTYWSELPNFLNSIGNPYSDNKLKLVGELLDVFSDFKEKTGAINTDRSKATRLMSTDSLYAINGIGEHQIQWRTALAVLDNTKVNYNGKTINAWEAIEIKDGKPVIKEGVKDFTIEDVIHLGLRIKALNQKLHGIYNDVDRNAIQKWTLGRMAMMFRKYIKPGINRRLDKQRYDYSLDSKVEGMYVTTFNFLNQLRKDFKSYSLIYNQLEPHQQANLKRTALEAGYMMMVLLLLGLAEAGLDDDKDNWLLAHTAYQANRLFLDLSFYANPISGAKIVKDPLAGIKTIESIHKLLNPLTSFDVNPFNEDPFILKFKSGRHKGETKIYRNAINLIPGVKNIEGIFEPEEKLKYFN